MRTKHKIRTSLLLCSQLLQCPDFQEKGSQQEGSHKEAETALCEGLPLNRRMLSSISAYVSARELDRTARMGSTQKTRCQALDERSGFPKKSVSVAIGKQMQGLAASRNEELCVQAAAKRDEARRRKKIIVVLRA